MEALYSFEMYDTEDEKLTASHFGFQVNFPWYPLNKKPRACLDVAVKKGILVLPGFECDQSSPNPAALVAELYSGNAVHHGLS